MMPHVSLPFGAEAEVHGRAHLKSAKSHWQCNVCEKLGLGYRGLPEVCRNPLQSLLQAREEPASCLEDCNSI